MAWGGARPGAGRKPTAEGKKPNPNRPRVVAEPKVKPAETKVGTGFPAEPKKDVVLGGVDPRAWMMMLPELEELSQKYALHKAREQTPGLNPFKLPEFPKAVLEGLKKQSLPTMAMDEALESNLGFGANSWLAGDVLGGLSGEGLLFLGYTYLSELAQRPEYRVMSETIADDATRKWIDFDVTGDEQKQKAEREKDPKGYDERMADPDERKKRVAAAGKTDRVKELQDDQLRLEVKLRYYEQARNGGFFGRTHLFHDIRDPAKGDEMDAEQLKVPIGNGRDTTSKTMCQPGFFQGLRTIEPVWTYPLMYNAINPLRKDWYNPQVWFVMGQEIHGTRLQTFIPHPVPDMLKPAYAFGGLSLSQMAKPYVDRWLTTVTSVNQLIHSFSVMVLMTDLSTLMSPNTIGPLLARVAAFNMFRDNQGAFVLNKNTEDFKNVQASLAGLHELQAQAQEHMTFPGRIPLVKFTGIQPAGLNASSEGEIEVYDDTIGAYQSRVLDPNLRRTINFEMLSLWGEVDPEITHRWAQLRPMTQAEKGTKEKDDADRDQKYVDMGAISPGEVRKRIIEDKDLPYTGLSPDDVPEPPAEEGMLGPGAGGAAAAFEKDATGQGEGDDKGGGATDADLPFAADNHWARDPITGEPVVLAGDEWSESDHPRGQPGNSGQFGAGGGGASGTGPKGPDRKEGRKYGGLYKSTGNGAKADHAATVEYALKSGPRAGSSYRELVTRLIKDTPEHGQEGDAEKLKGILAQSYLGAADQLRAKASIAPAEEKAKLEAMAQKALAKAEALGVKQVALPPDKAWTGAHGASPALRSFRDATRKDLVERGISSNLEDMSLWDVQGNKQIEMKAIDRSANNVQFTPEMIKAFEDANNNLELHHNHPGDMSFSGQDLDVLAHFPGMSRIYAHGHAGSTYEASGATKTGIAFRAVMQEAEGGPKSVYSAIGALPISAVDKGRVLQHANLSGLAKAGLVTGYVAHLAPDLKAIVDDLESDGLFGEWTDQVARRAAEATKGRKA